MEVFLITLDHDCGSVRIELHGARTISDAVEMICMIEGCPESAVQAIRRKRAKKKRT